jgi:hypothetical protein
MTVQHWNKNAWSILIPYVLGCVTGHCLPYTQFSKPVTCTRTEFTFIFSSKPHSIEQSGSFVSIWWVAEWLNNYLPFITKEQLPSYHNLSIRHLSLNTSTEAAFTQSPSATITKMHYRPSEPGKSKALQPRHLTLPFQGLLISVRFT